VDLPMVTGACFWQATLEQQRSLCLGWILGQGLAFIPTQKDKTEK
jgi:hypothetical protein